MPGMRKVPRSHGRCPNRKDIPPVFVILDSFKKFNPLETSHVEAESIPRSEAPGASALAFRPAIRNCLYNGHGKNGFARQFGRTTS
jgi:hypothetical protein